MLTTCTVRFAQAFSSKSATCILGRHSTTTTTSVLWQRAMSTSTKEEDAPICPDSLLESVLANKKDQETMVGNEVANAVWSLYKADAVCFDVDSTVIAEEGIDVLAEYLGKGAAVAELTKQAMEGNTKFEDAIQARLDLMRPSQPQITKMLDEIPLQLTKGIEGLIKSLQEKKVDVWLVSGGFRIMIEPVAQQLNIPISNIVANTILFDSNGDYDTFDKNEPTSRDMGKPKALQMIQKQKGYQTMVMVGDGATDAQAKPPAKAFIGFGGVVERQQVKEKADWFVTDFDSMTSVINMRTTS